jgi:hypothetical protein
MQLKISQPILHIIIKSQVQIVKDAKLNDKNSYNGKISQILLMVKSVKFG